MPCTICAFCGLLSLQRRNHPIERRVSSCVWRVRTCHWLYSYKYKTTNTSTYAFACRDNPPYCLEKEPCWRRILYTADNWCCYTVGQWYNSCVELVAVETLEPWPISVLISVRVKTGVLERGQSYCHTYMILAQQCPVSLKLRTCTCMCVCMLDSVNIIEYKELSVVLQCHV